MATKDKIVLLARDRKKNKFKLDGDKDGYLSFVTPGTSNISRITPINSMKAWPSILGVMRHFQRVLDNNGEISYSEKIDGSSAIVTYCRNEEPREKQPTAHFKDVIPGPYLEAKSHFFNAAYSIETGEIFYYEHRITKVYHSAEYLDKSLSYFYLELVLKSFIPYIPLLQKENQQGLELHTEVLYTCLPNSVVYDQGDHDINIFIYRIQPADSYDSSAIIALKKTFGRNKKHSFRADVPVSPDGSTIKYETRTINSCVGFLKSRRLTREQISDLLSIEYDTVIRDTSAFVEKFFSIAKPQTKSINIEGYVISTHDDIIGSEISETQRLYKIVNYHFAEIRDLVWAYRNRVKKHVKYSVKRAYETPWKYSRLQLLPLLVADAAGIILNHKSTRFDPIGNQDFNRDISEDQMELINLLIDEMTDVVKSDMELCHRHIPYLKLLRRHGVYTEQHLNEILLKDRLSCYEIRKRIQTLKHRLNTEYVTDGPTVMSISNALTN